MYYVVKYVLKWHFFQNNVPTHLFQTLHFHAVANMYCKTENRFTFYVCLVTSFNFFLHFVVCKFIASSCITLNEKIKISRTRSSMENATL